MAQRNELLPHSQEVEDAVIGSALIGNVDEFPEGVDKDDFYFIDNAILWGIILKIRKKGEPIDTIAISSYINEVEPELRDKGITNAFICDKMANTFSSANIGYYVKKLKELRRGREVIKIGDSLMVGEYDKGKILQMSDKLASIASIGDDASKSTVEYDDVNAAYEMMTERMGKKIWGYSWGKPFAFLDEYTRGIIKKQVYRIGAPSGVGKTQFVYNIIPELLSQKNSDGSDVKVLFFTLENPKELTLTSIMCKAKGIDLQDMNDGKIEGEWDYLVGLKDRLYIVDDLYSIDDIFAKVREVKPDIVILDYIGYINVPGFNDDGRFKEYAKRVVPFVKKNSIAWIDLSNLANDTQTNEEIRFKPKFYGASELVNNSDVNIFILRNEEFKKTKDKVMRDRFSYSSDDLAFFRKRNMLDMIITKNRWGPPGYETTFGINQSNGGIFKEIDKDEMGKLWAKFG